MRHRSEGSFQQVTAEGAALESEYGQLQHLFEKFKDPVHVSELCVKIRQSRPIPEQVRDAVEASLNEEAACPKHGRRMMEQFMQAVTKDLELINALREQLNDDVEQKSQSVSIDSAALQMNEGWTPPAGIAMMKSPVRQQQWRSNNEHLNTDAQRACLNGSRLREKSAAYRLELISTEHTVRTNLTDVVLPHQIATLEEQISSLSKELQKVETGQKELEEARFAVELSIDSKVKPLSLAQSRLQVRQSRPVQETVRDHAERMLQQEVTDYEVAIARLHQEVARVQREFDKLQDEKTRLEQQMADKQQALELEHEVRRLMIELGGRMVSVLPPDQEKDLYALKSGAIATSPLASGVWR